MRKKLTISACNFLSPEIAEVIGSGGYPDVNIIGFPANCTANSLTKSTFDKIIAKADSEGNDLIILSSTCNSLVNSPEQLNSRCKIITLKQCFEVIINHDMLLHYISKGYYIVTNGWLRSYDYHIKNWGFDKNTAKKFFNESMSGILFLDTKISGDYLPKLKALSNYMQLPYEILPIGLSYCKMYIDSLVLNWRNETERKDLNKRISKVAKHSADYSVIFSQLESIFNLTNEDEIISSGFNLLNILFAPSIITYTKFNADKTSESISFTGISSQIECTAENSFSFKIDYSNEIFGAYTVEGIQFSKFLTEYKSMSKNIGQILGISIANARKYEVILKQKSQIENYSHELQKSNNTKDKFFSIIAHDLKGPFNALIGFGEILQQKIDECNKEEIEKFVSIINKTLNETFNLLVNLLEWAQSQSNRIEFKPKSINLLASLGDLISLMMVQANKKGISVDIKIPNDIEVFADKNMLNTIVRNLMSNAIKFTNKGGQIVLSATTDYNQVQITVKDNGVGILQENIDKLFVLETASSKKGTAGEKGTGLGLVLCKEFVERHHGRFWVESEPGMGSQFHFTLQYTENNLG